MNPSREIADTENAIAWVVISFSITNVLFFAVKYMYHPVHSTFIDMQTGITIAGILTLILGAYVVFRKRQQTQKFPIILIVLLIFLFLIMIFMWMGYSKIYTAHMPIWQNTEHQLATQMEQHE